MSSIGGPGGIGGPKGPTGPTGPGEIDDVAETGPCGELDVVTPHDPYTTLREPRVGHVVGGGILEEAAERFEMHLVPAVDVAGTCDELVGTTLDPGQTHARPRSAPRPSRAVIIRR